MSRYARLEVVKQRLLARMHPYRCPQALPTEVRDAYLVALLSDSSLSFRLHARASKALAQAHDLIHPPTP